MSVSVAFPAEIHIMENTAVVSDNHGLSDHDPLGVIEHHTHSYLRCRVYAASKLLWRLRLYRQSQISLPIMMQKMRYPVQADTLKTFKV